MRCSQLPAALAAFVLLTGCTATGGVPARRADDGNARPNVILILADDLGYADLGAQGSVDLRTPNLDALARSGLQCTDAYVSAPQCYPSRAALMTGRYAQRFGIEHNFSARPTDLPLDQPTIAERFKAAGYATGLVGKWNLGEDDRHDPIARGFDEFFGFTQFAHRYVRNDRFKPDEEDRLRRGRTPVVESEYLTDAFARESRDFILRHADQPFFLFASFNAPHMPLQAKVEELAAFASLPDTVRAKYAAMVASLDDAVGVIEATLRETGLTRRTLVVFLSDNGADHMRGGRNDPLRAGKSTLWEGGIRIPWLVAWEGRVPAAGLEDRPVIQVDLPATFVSACGIAAGPGAFDGVDRLPRWTGRTNDAGTDPLYWRFFGGGAMAATHAWAIREGDWKLVLPSWRYGVYGQEDNFRLHDLRTDPGEDQDRAAEHPEIAARLQADWEAWNATLPPPSEGAAGMVGEDDE